MHTEALQTSAGHSAACSTAACGLPPFQRPFGAASPGTAPGQRPGGRVPVRGAPGLSEPKGMGSRERLRGYRQSFT
eukprot:CAMPEP_0174358346 /NCGR_PEP_ID=MMETSP0811_2-20130205/42135_1 /TAXON_ID=73025 ORGANISM="Eutreptiella gymnastica-like, Strain CCMP1594" /NCGR_SAMPLE_ID=MMETSP0811_2 /ASSEMBLY_ACC=CAM_ASM_000667 /LENGTH=75 /DNA_ID=CAMNT_0015492049 /DNA_START=184 /DNA_END=411 /DNA_ORIENTATION=+